MDAIQFQVIGRPATQGSKRAMPIYRKGGQPVMKDGRMLTRVVEDNPRLADWRRQVALAARDEYDGPLLECPIQLCLHFERPRPKGHYGTGRNAGKLKEAAPFYPTSRPDLGKLTRAVEDALTGVLYRDDSQIVYLVLTKGWGQVFSVEVSVAALTAGHDVLETLEARG